MDWQEEHKKRVSDFPADIRDAHVHSSNHRVEIVESRLCGCFYCCSTFSPTAILDWVDEGLDGLGQTALCPKCGIDSVIGDKSGFEISERFLALMKGHWF
jgi:hypothetical protein